MHAAKLLSLCLLGPLQGTPLDETHSFDSFRASFGRAYVLEEEVARREVFRTNLERIRAHNANPARSWSMGVNQFADMTDEEFERVMLMEPQRCSATGAVSATRQAGPETPLPESVDWRKQGVVSEVKNQGHCGSCWAFSTAAAVEAHSAIAYGQWRAPRLSEQQLVDCAQAFDNHGCNGGLPSHAFQYLQAAGGMSTEFSYPYKAKDGNCTFVPPSHSSAPFEPRSMGVGALVPGGSVNVTKGDELSLKTFLATKGPVSVAFQVAKDFRFYKSGVYSSTVCKNGPMDVNHAVLAVGYGFEAVSQKPYWLIKNSWDYTFGEEGYFRIEAFKNMCGVADCMAYPDVLGNKVPVEAVVV